MGFFLSWLVIVVFITLGSFFLYPIIRAGVKYSRTLKARRWRRGARGRALEAWTKVSSQLSLSLSSAEQPHQLALRGQLQERDADVHIESFAHKEEDYTRVTLQTDLDPTQELFLIEAQNGYHFIDSLTRRNPSYTPHQMKQFDRNFMLLGDELLGVALLDAEMRELVAGLVASTGLIHLCEGVLVFEREGLYESDEVFVGALRSLQRLVQKMALNGRSLASCLLHNYREDAEAGIRLRNLKELLKAFPNSDEANVASCEMLEDDEPEIRLFGAMRIGADGIPMIQAIAEEPNTPEALCIDAYKYLATQIKGQQSLYAVRVMLILLNSQELNSVAVIPIAQAIERYGVGLDEDTCLELLSWEQHPRVAYAIHTAACRLLMRCGTIKAIGPLMLHETSRNKELRKAAEMALLHVKARLGNPEAGGLSLIEVELDGALSGTEDMGALSLMEKILKVNDDPELQDGA